MDEDNEMRPRFAVGLSALVIASLLAGCSSATTTRTDSVKLPLQANASTNIRHARYCEVLPIYRDGAHLVAEVFNTIGLNSCPPDEWAKLDADELKDEFGAVSVKLNGPRAWVMDDIRSARKPGKQATFGGIPMLQQATVRVSWSMIFQGEPTPYTEPHSVKRKTTFVYEAGKPVHQLLAPDGSVYVMQTYDLTNIPDPESLATLSTRLKLPSGWQFRTIVPKTDLLLSVDGVATVIRDDLQNTYQLAPKAGL